MRFWQAALCPRQLATIARSRSPATTTSKSVVVEATLFPRASMQHQPHHLFGIHTNFDKVIAAAEEAHLPQGFVF